MPASTQQKQNAARKYLVVGPSWIGDMVMAQALFITLRQQHPDCEIDVLAPAWSLPVIARMPQVRRGIAADVAHGELSFFKRWRLGKKLRRENYSHAIVIPRSWKSALAPFAARVPVRTGYLGEMRFGLLNDRRVLNKAVLTQTVQRYVAHAWPANPSSPPAIPLPALSIDKANQERLLAELKLDLDRPLVCMMPGAEYGPAKQWPIDYYTELAGRLSQSGYQVWVIGSTKDSAAGEQISGKLAHVINLCGKTALVDSIDLLACAESVVCNDSGLMHVAAAVGVSINVIYGSTTPDYTPPLAKDEKKNIFYLDLPCSPCFKRVCPLGHTRCLTDIHADDIAQSILQ